MMELKMLKIDQIKPNPFELRESLNKEKLRELVDSIKEVEMREPIHVRKRGEKYEIIAGGRRWLAAKTLGLREIPAIIKDVDDKTLMVEALITNVHREDLSEIEKGRGTLQIFRLHGFMEEPRELAKEIQRIYEKIRKNLTPGVKEQGFYRVVRKIGLSERYLRDLLNVVSLPKDILEKEGKKNPEDRIDHHSLSGLATVEDERLLRRMYKYLEKKRLPREKATKLITQVKYSSEALRKYILSAEEEVDLEEIIELRMSFPEEDQARVIEVMMSGRTGSISEAMRLVKIEKGERDDFVEFPVKIRFYSSGEVMNEGYADNTIVDRFRTRDERRLPTASDEVVCPSFMELKWARGCPFNCAWCYLQGTLRHMKEGKRPYVYDYEEIKRRLIPHLKWQDPQLFVTGEIADSLMHENTKRGLPFSRFIIDIFKKYGNGNKVLFLSKNTKVDKLIKAKGQDVAIVSFSLNAYPVAEKWERAPHPRERLKAAKRVYKAGYETRIRIDPMVPIEGWEESYRGLVDDIFDVLEPERITFGSLRGLQSTIIAAKKAKQDMSWARFLSEKTEWGKKIAFDTRLQMYKALVDQIRGEHRYKGHLAMCKETLGMWTKMGWDYRKCKCNCVW